MKKLFLLIPVFLGMGASAWASSCPTGALSVYEGPGFSCNIGDLAFSDFSFSGITDTASTVDVITGTESGLEFPLDLTAIGSQSLNASIGYSVTCDACTMDDWELQTGGAGSTGTGAVTVIELSTPGALFQTTEGGVTSGIGSATFSPADSVLPVTTSIILGGGATGTVTTIASTTNLFSITSNSTVPEPSLLFLCAGLLGVLPFARRRFAH